MIDQVAILSDIHGNAIALENVLTEIKTLGIFNIWILGDYVGYYYQADKVIQLLENIEKSHKVRYIKGNHDRWLIKCKQNPNILSIITQKYGHGIDHALKTLSNKQISKMNKLPNKMTFKIKGRRILLSHGAPWNKDEYIYPDTDPDNITRLSKLGYDVILMGHTHRPFVCQKNSTLIANVGSVGEARDKGGQASWVIYIPNTNSIIFKHTPYDIKPLIKDVNKYDNNKKQLIEVLNR
jgi:putative phosphoesterase